MTDFEEQCHDYWVIARHSRVNPDEKTPKRLEALEDLIDHPKLRARYAELRHRQGAA